MSNAKVMQSIISNINTGKSYPALSIVEKEPEVAAVISKLITSRYQQRFNDEKNNYANLDQSRLTEISRTIKERAEDSENMMQLFPDMELAAQILISSILSPKDMVKSEILYGTTEKIFPSEITSKILPIIQEEINRNYKLEDRLNDMLREMLFDSGSYIQAIIPESSVDELINKGISIASENLKEIFDEKEDTVHLGILGNRTKQEKTINIKNNSIVLESFNLNDPNKQKYQSFSPSVYSPVISEEEFKIDNVEVSDNFFLLKLPKILDSNNKNKIKSVIRNIKNSNPALEGYTNKLTEREIESILYKGVQPNAANFVSIKTEQNSKRKSVGRPLTLKLPSESVIPVYVPGDPKSHIGYFVLIDEDGNPISKTSSEQNMQGLQSQLSSGGSSIGSYLLKKAKRNLVSQDTKNLTIDQAAKIYSDIVETDLIDRLKNGLYGSRVAISKQQDIYRIMLARTFANQFTRLVFIPSELVTYYAYKYYDNGTGKSLLDDLKIINSLRAMLLFAKVLALTKNSIAVTHVNMSIDPNDPDPFKTIEMSINEIIKTRQQNFPLGINTPIDLVDWIQRAGFEFSFEGHPGIPQTKFDFETKSSQHTVPDNDLDEMLRKQSIMAVGLSPETVDNGFNAEFATTVVQNNILLSKRVLQIQNQFEPKLSDEAKKICLNDSDIKTKIFDIVKENISLIKNIDEHEEELKQEDEVAFVNFIIEKFINSLDLRLPKPDITTLENQSEAFNHYSEALDAALNSILSSEFITSDIAGDLSNNIDSIRAAYKAYFLRQWMAENGYMHELTEILSVNDNGKSNVDIFDIMKNHINSILRGSVKFLEAIKPMKEGANKDLDNMNLDNSNTGSDSSSDFSSSENPESENNGSDESSSDLNLGIGDLNMD